MEGVLQENRDKRVLSASNFSKEQQDEMRAQNVALKRHYEQRKEATLQRLDVSVRDLRRIFPFLFRSSLSADQSI